MKIGILLNGMSGIGGIQRITAGKINTWIEVFGYEVVLITKNQGNAPFVYELNKNCKYYNLDISSKFGGGIIAYIKNIPKGFKFFVKLKKILESESVDILFTTIVGFDSLVVPFVNFKIPKILEIHSSGYSYNKNTWFFKKQIIRKYDRVALLTKSEIDYFGLNNTVVIPNFIDKSDEDCFVNKKRNIIISAGRIAPVKQFDHLVDIWSTIATKHPDWEVHIYGSGSIKPLNEKIDEMGLQLSFKIFPGTIEIKSKMQEASIFVLVSATEAFPMVLLEAMEAELPIVSYDSPHGPKNIITDGTDGFLVSLNDKVAFSEKLNTLIENPELRADFVLNQKVKLDLFSKKNVMNQWNDLICNILNK
ncbi:MAG: glycosyltransferase family 4 protein [Lutibacter sp.]